MTRVDQIIHAAARAYDVESSEMYAPSCRRRRVIEARVAAVGAIQYYTLLSQAEIALAFGRRCHSTVCGWCRSFRRSTYDERLVMYAAVAEELARADVRIEPRQRAGEATRVRIGEHGVTHWTGTSAQLRAWCDDRGITHFGAGGSAIADLTSVRDDDA